MTSPLVARRHKNCETFLPLVQTIVIFANKLSKVNDSQGLGGTYFDDLLLYANYWTMITIRNFKENFKERESHQKSKLNLIFAQSCLVEDYKVLQWENAFWPPWVLRLKIHLPCAVLAHIKIRLLSFCTCFQLKLKKQS